MQQRRVRWVFQLRLQTLPQLLCQTKKTAFSKLSGACCLVYARWLRDKINHPPGWSHSSCNTQYSACWSNLNWSFLVKEFFFVVLFLLLYLFGVIRIWDLFTDERLLMLGTFDNERRWMMRDSLLFMTQIFANVLIVIYLPNLLPAFLLRRTIIIYWFQQTTFRRSQSQPQSRFLE